MKITVEITIEGYGKEEIISIQRESLTAETVGLRLEEAKIITTEIQKKMVERQVEGFTSESSHCTCCGEKLSIKGHNTLVYRTLFGRFLLKAPVFEIAPVFPKKVALVPCHRYSLREYPLNSCVSSLNGHLSCRME